MLDRNVRGITVKKDHKAQRHDKAEPLVQDQLQQTLANAAEVVQERRTAFFTNPDDVETNHHLRTSIRRLRSLVAFVKPWQRSRQNAETQTILRDIVRHTSLLRELDVFEGQARADSSSSPELIALCANAAAAERAKVLNALSSAQVTRPFERAMALAKNVEWKKRYATQGIPRGVVRARFDSMVESVTAELVALDPSDAEHTHDVRKRAKRARYVAELCADVLEADAVDVAKGMNAHQDGLGDICDARANIRLIDGFLEQDLSESVRQELVALRAQNEAHLLDAQKQYGRP